MEYLVGTTKQGNFYCVLPGTEFTGYGLTIDAAIANFERQYAFWNDVEAGWALGYGLRRMGLAQ